LIEFCNKGFLKVIISYDNLYYTSVDEVPAMNLNDLLGNLGGQLGLFIGISFLSLVELIELIVTLSLTVYYQRKGKIMKNRENTITPFEELVQTVNTSYTEPIKSPVKLPLAKVESTVIGQRLGILNTKPKLNMLTKSKKLFS
jgi:hypothetical protein